jgi:methylated-DNA-[protein]-cysteine S-methyltransferase
VNHLQLRIREGTIALTWNSAGKLTRLDWYEGVGGSDSRSCGGWSVLDQAASLPPNIQSMVSQMRAYFTAGEPMPQVPWEWLDLAGCTDFQSAVYRAISIIPHGETRTYAWVAKRIGKFAPRAVGQALRRNPFPMVLPCHRVVATGDTLGGFMGSSDPNEPELRLKKWLLDLENEYRNPVFSFLNGGLSA